MEEKVVCITGAARGIGKEIAKKFAKEGYCLGINYVSDSTDLVSLEKELREASSKDTKIEFLKGNVANMSKCEEMISKLVARFGRIDVLINNAGITRDSLLARMKEEDFSNVLDVNLKGTFNTIKQCTPIFMKQREGRIINISSVVGISGNAGQCNYAASKAGIIGLTKSVAKELAGRNILVNAIAPGFIDTDMTKILNEKVKEEIERNIPLKRMGEAREVANAVYFLGSHDNTYITGQVLTVDGGMIM